MSRKIRYLVTGGAGFIGSHITQRLLQDGHFVRVLDNFSSGKTENLSFTRELKSLRAYELIRADIRDRDACFKATKGVDCVLHQAALRSVPKSLDNPADYNDVNIGGTLNMLEAGRKAKVKSFVFASSSSIYGDTKQLPQREDARSLLISPYALSKLAGEYYCRIFSLNWGLNTVCLRYFNVFGPRQALDDEYAVVIPKFITCLLNDQQPPVYGTGRQSRDFTYIDNVVEANMLAAHSRNRKTDVFNVALGKDYSILELVRVLNTILGKDVRPLFLPARQGDVFRTLADLSKIKKGLGFKPKVDFLRGLELTVKYFQSIHA